MLTYGQKKSLQIMKGLGTTNKGCNIIRIFIYFIFIHCL